MIHLEEFRMSRRAALQGAGALGLMSIVSTPRNVFAAAQNSTPAEGDDYPELVVNAVEYAFDMPASVAGGLTKITFNNNGVMDHHAIFLRVNDDSTVEAVQEALKQPEFGPVFAVAKSVGGPGCGPGQTTSVVVDLEPGKYLVICAIPDESGVPHYALGMLNQLDVTEGESTAEAPAADATIHLVDFMFHDLPSEVTAGAHTWEVVDDGAQVHELGVCKIAEGFTFEKIQEILMAPPDATPAAGGPPAASSSPMAMDMEMAPPFEQVAGVAPMSAGVTNWLLLDLEAGDYFAICFVPDSNTGAPHFALGMIMPFTVA